MTDFLENPKGFNRANLPLILAGSISHVRSSNFKQISDIYKTARNNYAQLHKNYPNHQIGVTVNKSVTLTKSYNYVVYRIYDIYTHRYLSGGSTTFTNH